MKVDTMRTIDKWVGIPACFLFSFVVRFLDLFTRKKDGIAGVQNTLFLELSEMGSAIIADPAMQKMKLEGKANLYFAIFKDNAKSVDILATVDSENIFRMKSHNLYVLLIDIFRFSIWCHKKKIDCIIDLELFSRFTALLCGLSGAPRRVGFASYHDEGLYRGNIINYPVRYNPHVHMAVNFISLVNSALGKHSLAYPTTKISTQEIELLQAQVTDNQRELVKNKIRGLYSELQNQKILLFNVNASDLLPQRRWLPDRFAWVAKELLTKHDDIIIVATGAPAEREYVQNVVDMVGDSRCVNSAGVFNFEELIPLYCISHFMITNDSGPAHFASVTPLKVFVIFGPETPALYLPLGNAEPFYLGLPCSPCVSAANHRKTSCVERPCITGLPKETVLNRLDKYLVDN